MDVQTLRREQTSTQCFNAEVGHVRTTDVGCAKYSGMSYATYWVGLMEVSKHVTQAAWYWAS